MKPHPYQQHRGPSHKTNTHKKHKLVTGGSSLREKHPAFLQPHDLRKCQHFGIEGLSPSSDKMQQVAQSVLSFFFLITSRLVLETSKKKKEPCMHVETGLMIVSPLGARNNKESKKNWESQNDEEEKDVLSASFFVLSASAPTDINCSDHPSVSP